MIIYKYSLNVPGTTVLHVPQGAQVLSVAIQDDMFWVWMLVDKDRPLVKRGFAAAGTGWELGNNMNRAVHVGTVHPTPLVWHVFDTGEEAPRAIT